MAEEEAEKSVPGPDGIRCCKAYQGIRRPGQPACPSARIVCTNGAHKCSGCGQKGHGKGDCRTVEPPPNTVPSKKRPFAASTSTSTSVASAQAPAPPRKKERFSAIGKDVCPDGQSTPPSTSDEDRREDAFAVNVTEYGSGNVWLGQVGSDLNNYDADGMGSEPIGLMRSTLHEDFGEDACAANVTDLLDKRGGKCESTGTCAKKKTPLFTKILPKTQKNQ